MKAPKSRPGRPNPKRIAVPAVPEYAARPAPVAPMAEPAADIELDETIRKMLEAAYT